jgi:hypothetical protein
MTKNDSECHHHPTHEDERQHSGNARQGQADRADQADRMRRSPVICRWQRRVAGRRVQQRGKQRVVLLRTVCATCRAARQVKSERTTPGSR